jgi:hypothetical protein
MKILIFLISMLNDYYFSPFSGNKFLTCEKAISILKAPSISEFNKQNLLISFSYSNPYQIGGLNFFEGAILKNLKILKIGIGYEFFGTDFYKENEYLLGISFNKENINLGINFKILNLYIKENFSKFGFGMDFGTSFSLFENLKIGFFSLNFNSPKIIFQKVYPSSSISISFKENKNFETLFDLNYEEKYTSLNFAQKFHVFKKLIISAGISIEPPLFSIIFEIPFENINFSYSFKNHPILGGYNSYEIDIKR